MYGTCMVVNVLYGVETDNPNSSGSQTACGESRPRARGG